MKTMQRLTGMQYLKGAIVCAYDKAYEKVTWDKRIERFAYLDIKDPSLFTVASNPIGLRAAIGAYEDTLAGIPTGYLISLDATSSGLQFLSLLSGCEQSFSLCGGNSDECVDSYTSIYEAMAIGDRLTRKETKQCIMTAFYGSTATPQAVFGEDVDLFYDTLEHMAPGAWNLNLGLQDVWEALDSHEYAWILPDNFHAEIRTKVKEHIPFTFKGNSYSVTKETEGRPKFHKGLGPNLIHSIDALVAREMMRRCAYEKHIVTRVINALDSNGTTGKSASMVEKLWTHYQKTGFLSVRILDYLYKDTMGCVDSLVIAKLLKSLPEEPFDIVTIHDNFKCHPNKGNDVRYQYNTVMADISESSLLNVLLQQILGSDVSVSKVGTIPRETIQEGNYLLC